MYEKKEIKRGRKKEKKKAFVKARHLFQGQGVRGHIKRKVSFEIRKCIRSD